MEYRDCSWNLTCSNVTSIGTGNCGDNCTSGCFCAGQMVLYNGVCSNATVCSGIHIYVYMVEIFVWVVELLYFGWQNNKLIQIRLYVLYYGVAPNQLEAYRLIQHKCFQLCVGW